jgi:nucleotide-binding universal stress UspA family protein
VGRHGRARARAARRASDPPEDGIEADLLEPIGDPATTIERIANEGDFDVIVVGTRDLGAIGRTFQGSVSEHIATHAKATVVVAR